MSVALSDGHAPDRLRQSTCILATLATNERAAPAAAQVHAPKFMLFAASVSLPGRH